MPVLSCSMPKKTIINKLLLIPFGLFLTILFLLQLFMAPSISLADASYTDGTQYYQELVGTTQTDPWDKDMLVGNTPEKGIQGYEKVSKDIPTWLQENVQTSLFTLFLSLVSIFTFLFAAKIVGRAILSLIVKSANIPAFFLTSKERGTRIPFKTSHKNNKGRGNVPISDSGGPQRSYGETISPMPFADFLKDYFFYMFITVSSFLLLSIIGQTVAFVTSGGGNPNQTIDTTLNMNL